MKTRSPLRVVVQGTGDVGSAVAHRLFLAGRTVVLQESREPAVTRRGMAFADAVFDGQAVLEGVQSARIDDPSKLPRCLLARTTIPVVVLDLAAILELVHPEVLVDARMRKRARAEYPPFGRSSEMTHSCGVTRSPDSVSFTPERQAG